MIIPRFQLNLFHFFPKPFVPKKAPRSVKAAQALRKDSTEQANTQSMRRESSESPPIHPLSRESSEIIASQALRKTEVKIETQPNGSEVTTTIMEIADPVKTFLAHHMYFSGDMSLYDRLEEHALKTVIM